ncbi:G-PROTEIN-RECEP-F1-2 domain-containing protein [Aphelenchoides besseyi]|nr:G-PROTEIN-RECEP-F1-2 domain-containing protein [Aphelenchoides besseyi]
MTNSTHGNDLAHLSMPEYMYLTYKAAGPQPKIFMAAIFDFVVMLFGYFGNVMVIYATIRNNIPVCGIAFSFLGTFYVGIDRFIAVLMPTRYRSINTKLYVGFFYGITVLIAAYFLYLSYTFKDNGILVTCIIIDSLGGDAVQLFFQLCVLINVADLIIYTLVWTLLRTKAGNNDSMKRVFRSLQVIMFSVAAGWLFDRVGRGFCYSVREGSRFTAMVLGSIFWMVAEHRICFELPNFVHFQKSVRLEVAQPADAEAIHRFLNSDFVYNEPMNRSVDLRPEDFDVFIVPTLEESLSDGLSIIAIDNQNICGVFINKVHESPKIKAEIESMEMKVDYEFDKLSIPSEKFKPIALMLNHVDILIPLHLPSDAQSYMKFKPIFQLDISRFKSHGKRLFCDEFFDGGKEITSYVAELKELNLNV